MKDHCVSEADWHKSLDILVQPMRLHVCLFIRFNLHLQFFIHTIQTFYLKIFFIRLKTTDFYDMLNNKVWWINFMLVNRMYKNICLCFFWYFKICQKSKKFINFFFLKKSKRDRKTKYGEKQGSKFRRC